MTEIDFREATDSYYDTADDCQVFGHDYDEAAAEVADTVKCGACGRTWTRGHGWNES